jgi:hypothetical protein
MDQRLSDRHRRPYPVDPAHVLYRRVRPSDRNREIARRELARMREIVGLKGNGLPVEGSVCVHGGDLSTPPRPQRGRRGNVVSFGKVLGRQGGSEE